MPAPVICYGDLRMLWNLVAIISLSLTFPSGFFENILHVLNHFGSVYGDDDVSFIKIQAFCRLKGERTLVALSYNRNGGIKVPGSSLVGFAFFFSCLSFSFFFFLIYIYIFYHSYHENNCLSREYESFFNNSGQNIVTAYGRDINK